MAHDRRTEAAYKRQVRKYLRELSCLSGKIVTEADLVPVELLDTIRSRASMLASKPKQAFEIPFAMKTSMRFVGYIDALCRLNPSPVYIWTPRTKDCGLFKLESVKAINLSFGFDVNPEGIANFLATDFADELVFDFSEDHSEGRTLEVESRGDKWSSVRY